MPKYSARVQRDFDGSWLAAALALPNCWSRGRSREEALAKLRDEIRYRIEYCPCSGVADDYVQLEVAHERGSAPAAPASGSAPSLAPAPAEQATRPTPGWKRWDD
jgi:hypothetical protein